jgi:hypothetical protein
MNITSPLSLSTTGRGFFKKINAVIARWIEIAGIDMCAYSGVPLAGS